MVKHKVRFNYFVPQLANENNVLVDWDMTEFFETIIGNKRAFGSAVILGEEISDLEWGSCLFDETNNLYYIQLSKLRSKNIPSRKKVDQDKQDINLADDEFLGEFNLLIYDPNLNILITQSNFYGLSVKQITQTLSTLRLRIKDFLGQPDVDIPYIAHLAPVIDPNAIGNVMKNEIYRKITIKGADFNKNADENINSDILSGLISSMGKIQGVNFELSFSMAKAKKNESLDPEYVREMIEDIMEIKGKNEDSVAMHVSSRRDVESALENIDLFTPKLSSAITLDVQNRATIGAEYIFNGFKEQVYYNESQHIQTKLRMLLPK